MTGLEIIIKERKKQVNKGYTPEHDQKYNNMELQIVARCVLSNSLKGWPKSWDTSIFYNFINEPLIERLAIVAALIAGEIDRIKYTEPNENLYKKVYVDDQDAYGYDVKSDKPKCGNCNCVYSCKNDHFA